jgi:hypothetical protein
MPTQPLIVSDWVPTFDRKPLAPLEWLETMALLNTRPNRDIQNDWNNPLTKRYTNLVDTSIQGDFEHSVIMLFRLKEIPRGKEDPQLWGMHFACWMVSRALSNVLVLLF